MAKNLQTARSVLIIGFLQSILSTQTLEFVAMLDQQVQTKTTYLNEKYEWLTANYEKLRRLVIEMISQIGGTYALSNWPHSLGDN